MRRGTPREERAVLIQSEADPQRCGIHGTGRNPFRLRVTWQLDSLPVTLKIKIHATKATGQNVAWAATSLAGTIVMSFHYATSAAFYCPASTVKGSLAGTPA
jgi:hypothetical protein